MRIIFALLVLSKLCQADTSSAVPSPDRQSYTREGFLRAEPGGLVDVAVTEDNLLSKKLFKGSSHIPTGRDLDSRTLPIKLINNFKHNDIQVYITGLDSSSRVFFALENGKLLYPDAAASRIPVKIKQNIAITLPSEGEPLHFVLPSFIRSGRIYFSDNDLQFFVVDLGDGNSLVQPSVTNMRDPNANVNWGFVELTYIKNRLYANISYVDFVGIVLGMKLATRDGQAQTAAGLQPDAVEQICSDLVNQTVTDSYEWTSLCITDTTSKPIRVLSPGNRNDMNPKMIGSYWKAYVNKVWERYTSRDLMIDTQTQAGIVRCRVTDHKLKCDKCERVFSKPADKDIWGCNSGPFAISKNASAPCVAIVPRLCAGLVRSTLLLDDGFMQPSLSLGPASYYTVDPTNHYSRIVHSYEADGKGYAFPYDDVNPDNEDDASGAVSSNNVDLLTVHVGGQLPSYLAR
ncbi:hypothetical protein FSARC_7032 [Fusarium sarcochroum]|uniref:GH64 domain-containing protein n=1 Tax=Fusarium sarcochroum TaxID=1208366 RepID=A0A8H4X7S2_9HYPO|nr:hypothetical protein FSARC_7032 [Fusarium sarcochroum]